MPEDVARKSLDEIAVPLLQVLQSLYTAAKTVVIYPAESPPVVRAIDSAHGAVMSLIPPDGSLDLSFIEGKLVVNGEMMDEAMQKRGIIGNFHELMKARRMSSITFWSGLTKDELHKFLAILGTKAGPAGEENEVYVLMEEQGIKHVEIDEQIFVAISKREKVVDARATVEHEEDAALRALKDEVFTRFLAGEVSLGEMGPDAIKAVASDPDKMVAMVQGVIDAQGWDSTVETLPFRIDETRAILERLSAIISQVDDPLLRSKLDKEVAKITSELDTPQLTDMLIKSAGIDGSGNLPGVLMPLLGESKLADVIDSVILEYNLLATDSADDWPTPNMSAMANVLTEAAGTLEGEEAAATAAKIERAGIEKARVDQVANISGVELAKSLMAGSGTYVIDMAKGPALVGAARHLFENGANELGATVMDSLAERFRKQSPEARIVAAQQIWGLFKMLREMGKEQYIEGLKDEVSATIDEGRSALWAISDLSKTMEEVAAEGGMSEEEMKAIGSTVMPVTGKTLERLMSTDTSKVVQAVFDSGDKAAQEAISKVLLGMEDRAVPALLDTAQKETDEEKLQALADSLSKLSTDPVPQIVSRFAGEITPQETMNLVRLVALVGDESSAQALDALQQSEDIDIRIAVMKTVSTLGGKHALSMVLAESSDIDPRIRATAVRELGRFHDYLAVKRLLEVIAPRKKGEMPEDNAVVMAACRSLGQLNARQAIGNLAEMATGGKHYHEYPEEVRAAAVQGLGILGGDEAHKALKRLLKDNSMLVRSTARKALGA